LLKQRDKGLVKQPAYPTSNHDGEQTAEQNPTPAVAVAVAVAKKTGPDDELASRPLLNGPGRPAGPAVAVAGNNNGNGDRPLPLPLPLPLEAVELLALVSDSKRPDVEQQFREAMTELGAVLDASTRVPAQSPAHFRAVCSDVLRDCRRNRIRKPDAIGKIVLERLRKPWAETDASGRTVTEAAAHSTRQQEIADAGEQRHRVAAAEQWAKDNPADYAMLRASVCARYPGHETSLAMGAAFEGEVLTRVHARISESLTPSGAR